MWRAVVIGLLTASISCPLAAGAAPPAPDVPPAMLLPIVNISVLLGDSLSNVKAAAPWLKQTPEGLSYAAADTEGKPVPYDVDVAFADGIVTKLALSGNDEGEDDAIKLRNKAWKALDADLSKRMGKPSGKCGKPKAATAAAVCTWSRGQFRVVRTVSLYNEGQWSHTYELSRK